MTPRILVVDDEKLIRWSLTERLGKEGLEVREAADGTAGVRLLETEPFDLALVDLKLPDTDGLAILRRAQDLAPELPVILITAHATVETAIEAMKVGAYDYVAKPFSMDDLVLTVRRALEATELRRDAAARLREEKARYGFHNFVARSPKLLDILDLAKRVARSEATTILLRGESGTGKDVLARAIHYESPRAARAFQNITCTAIQDTLLESELFGHERGAFTDAKAQKKGLFELADGGTAFLDEIGDMSPNLQAKLLRVLEEKTFRRVGGTTDLKVDVRIIAATNRDLEQAIRDRAFREDLYYRMNVIPIVIPPLRERPEDVPPLVEHFLRHFSREFKRPYRGVTADAMKTLESHDWPGNVRELRNVIERACLLSSGEEIGSENLLLSRAAVPAEPAGAAFSLPARGLVLEELEKDLVVQALQRTGGNQTKAAELLGISRDQLRYRMEKYSITPPA